MNEQLQLIYQISFVALAGGYGLYNSGRMFELHRAYFRLMQQVPLVERERYGWLEDMPPVAVLPSLANMRKNLKRNRLLLRLLLWGTPLDLSAPAEATEMLQRLRRAILHFLFALAVLFVSAFLLLPFAIGWPLLLWPLVVIPSWAALRPSPWKAVNHDQS
ncbi:hypothetical protein [Pseudophaeobacter sp.]|uniref:hypothetical protein n=1 Tax=Pseudophaeobacter sp. TaxID=1971739 RepID=UPI003298781B